MWSAMLPLWAPLSRTFLTRSSWPHRAFALISSRHRCSRPLPCPNTPAPTFFSNWKTASTPARSSCAAQPTSCSTSPAEERARGVVTASTGNHALAVAHAAAQLDVAATIYLPERASPRKVEKLSAFPVALCRVPGDALNAEISAREAAAQRGQVFISPYNDPHIIAGQGTIAVELLRQQPQLDAVFATVGGGGLMGGIACYLKASGRAVQTIGCQPERSAVMLASVRAGRIVEEESSLPTLSDGSAGGIEELTITFDLCRRHVDHWRTVSEEEIAAAMRLIYHERSEIIEGAAGVAVASLLKMGRRFAGQRLAIVICGGNVDEETWQRVLEPKE